MEECRAVGEDAIEMSTSRGRWRRTTNREVVSLPPLQGDVVEQALINNFSKAVGHHVRKAGELVKEPNATLGH